MMANRNGFFYVNDRVTGEFIRAQAVRDHDVVERDRTRRPAGAESGTGADRSRHRHVSRAVRRHQLHVAVVRRDARPLLRHRARDLHALHQPAAGGDRDGRHADARRQRVAGVGAGQVVRRAARPRRGDRRAKVGDSVCRCRLGRRHRHGRRRRLQRGSRRDVLRRRFDDGEEALRVSDRVGDLRAADDLPARRQAVRRDARRLDADGVCVAASKPHVDVEEVRVCAHEL